MQTPARVFQVLHEVAVAAAGLRDRAGLSALVVERASELLEADAAILYWYRPESGRLETLAHNDPIDATPEPPFPPGEGAAGLAFSSAQPQAVADYPAWPRATRGAVEMGIRSALAVPLLVADHAVGAMGVFTRSPREWQADDESLLTLFAAQVGPALEAARLFEVSESRRAEAEALAEQVRARGAELAAVIEQIPSGVYVADRSGSIILMNETALQLLGLAPQPMRADLAHSPITVRHPRTRRVLEPEETAVRRALRGQRVEKEETILSSAAWPEDRMFEISAVPLREPGGEPSGAVVVFSDVTRERRLVAELAESERRFRSLYGMISCGVLVQDAEGRVVDANAPAEEIIGRTLEEMRGKRTGTLWKAFTEGGLPLPIERRPTLLALKTRRPIRGTVMGIERPSGEVRWLQIDTVPFVDEGGISRQVVSSFIDITARKAAEHSLAASESQLRAIFDQAPIGLARVGLDGVVLESNRVAQEMLGYAADELCGRQFRTLLGAGDHDADAQILAEFGAGLREHYQAERAIQRRDGGSLWAAVNATLVRDRNGRPLYLIGMLADVSERRAQTERLEYRALHDALTDLPNRTLLNDRLQQAILTAQREDRQLALLLVDLNRFKEVNDNFGHHLGDLLLQQVGPRIRSLLRESDTVARLGGDEFAVVLPTVGDEEGARLAADRILTALAEPFAIGERNFEIGGSIGIAICPQHGLDPAALMRHADNAMYVAKRGRLGYTLFRSD